MHEGALFGLRGAGGQSRIEGTLCSLDVGVRQLYSTSFSSSLIFCATTPTLLSLPPMLLEAWGVDEVRVLTVSSRDFDEPCKKSRSVDMVERLWFCFVKGWQ